jgi:hypothetical protein
MGTEREELGIRERGSGVLLVLSRGDLRHTSDDEKAGERGRKRDEEKDEQCPSLSLESFSL